jgi:hypothetical protein
VSSDVVCVHGCLKPGERPSILTNELVTVTCGWFVSGSHASVEELGTAIMTAILVTVMLRVSS